MKKVRITDQEIEAKLIKAAQRISVGSSTAGWAALSEQVQAANNQAGKKGFFVNKRTLGKWILFIGSLSILTLITARYFAGSADQPQISPDKTEAIFTPLAPKEKNEKMKSLKGESLVTSDKNETAAIKPKPILIDTNAAPIKPEKIESQDSTKKINPFIFW